MSPNHMRRSHRSTKGQRRTRGPKLNDHAAIMAYGAGQTLAGVARAAGSRATSDRNARRVGYKIVQRLRSRGELLDRFAAVGVNLDTLCANIAQRMDATRSVFVVCNGRTMRFEVPDWSAQAKATEQFVQLTGIADLPATAEPDLDTLLCQLIPDDQLEALYREAQAEAVAERACETAQTGGGVSGAAVAAQPV